MSAGPSSGGDVRELLTKIKYYDRLLKENEKERTALLSRVTIAETKVDALQSHL